MERSSNPHTSIWLASLLLGGFATAPASVFALTPPTAVGSAFQINAIPLATAENIAVARATDGRFVTVWDGTEQKDSTSTVYVRAFAGDGTPLENEFQVAAVATGTSSIQIMPKVAVAAGGAFMVVWSEINSQDTETVYKGRLFNADGTPSTDEFCLDAGCPAQTVPQYYVALHDTTVSVDAAGRFVVAWIDSSNKFGWHLDVKAQRYGTDGAPVDTAPVAIYSNKVSTKLTDYAIADLALTTNSITGGFAVAWTEETDRFLAPEEIIVHSTLSARFYDDQAAPLGRAAVVDNCWGYSLTQNGGCRVKGAAVSSSGGAGWWTLVWWHGTPAFAGNTTLYGRNYNAAGKAQGGSFSIAEAAGISDIPLSLAEDVSGNFVAGWLDSAQAVSSYNQLVGPAFSIAEPGNDVLSSSIATDTAGNLVTTWIDVQPQGSDSSVSQIRGQFYQFH